MYDMPAKQSELGVETQSLRDRLRYSTYSKIQRIRIKRPRQSPYLSVPFEGFEIDATLLENFDTEACLEQFLPANKQDSSEI